MFFEFGEISLNPLVSFFMAPSGSKIEDLQSVLRPTGGAATIPSSGEYTLFFKTFVSLVSLTALAEDETECSLKVRVPSGEVFEPGCDKRGRQHRWSFSGCNCQTLVLSIVTASPLRIRLLEIRGHLESKPYRLPVAERPIPGLAIEVGESPSEWDADKRVQIFRIAKSVKFGGIVVQANNWYSLLCCAYSGEKMRAQTVIIPKSEKGVYRYSFGQAVADPDEIRIFYLNRVTPVVPCKVMLLTDTGERI
jgi:hypothetical protein